MTKKLWTVEVTNEIVVLAESREDAEREARKVSRLDMTPDYFASEMLSIPSGWHDEDVPYGEHEKTIDECIADGCAPRLRRKERG
jgi:hypothetical protein